MDLDEILAKAKEAVNLGARELHIVGGLHPDNPFSYYTDMLKMLRKNFPKVNLKCFTAVEICHFAHRENRSVESILAELKEAGLDTMPGGAQRFWCRKLGRKFAGKKRAARNGSPFIGRLTNLEFQQMQLCSLGI